LWRFQLWQCMLQGQLLSWILNPWLKLYHRQNNNNHISENHILIKKKRKETVVVRGHVHVQIILIVSFGKVPESMSLYKIFDVLQVCWLHTRPECWWSLVFSSWQPSKEQSWYWNHWLPYHQLLYSQEIQKKTSQTVYFMTCSS